MLDVPTVYVHAGRTYTLTATTETVWAVQHDGSPLGTLTLIGEGWVSVEPYGETPPEPWVSWEDALVDLLDYSR